MPSRLNLLGLTTLDGRPTQLAKVLLAVAVVVAFGAGFLLRPDPGAEATPATAAVRSEVVLEGGAEAPRPAPRLAGAPALPALDRTPRRKARVAATPVAAVTATPTPETTPSAREPEATPVSTPAPAAPAPPAAAPAPPAPRPAPAPARPAPPPTGQSFDSEG